ncbi:MAG: hypothetical protein WCT20_04200 [Candidatus Babeliales bacterium]|jgi:hypothetical protein
MKSINKIMTDIDVKVDETMAPAYGFFKKYFTLMSSALLSLLVLMFFVRMYNSKPQYLASIIKEDLLIINHALTRIDKECHILTIRSDSTTVDFLTVQKFVGSMVGGINLAYPENWKGPYLQTNPTYQSKPYSVVKGLDGFFIVPGNGVTLPNGKTIGKDIIINEKTAVSPMLMTNGALTFKGSQLGFKITFKIGTIEREPIKPETIAKVNNFLNEFNAALPYAYNQHSYELQAPLKQFTA